MGTRVQQADRGWRRWRALAGAVAAVVGCAALGLGSASAASGIVSATATVQFSGQVATAAIDCTAPVTSPSGTIDWGDGTAVSPASLSESGGLFVISGMHTYAAQGAYSGSVSGSFRCDGGPFSFTAGFTAQVAAAPAVASGAITATEGAPWSGAVVSVPAGCTPVASPAATIDWGDGSASSPASVAVAGSELTITAAHTYAEEGAYQGSLSGGYLCDGDRVPIGASFTARVADAPLQASAAMPPALAAGARFAGPVASFTDADPAATASDYAVALSWGDGTASPASVTASGGRFLVTASHAYAEPGTYHVEVAIRDAGGAVADATAAVTVHARAGARLRIGGMRSIGDGTAVLSLRLPGSGMLTVAPAGRHAYLRTLREHVSAGRPVTLILRPTDAARRLELDGRRVDAGARLTLKLVTGARITRNLPPVVFDIATCAPGMVFHYTGAEQACVVPGPAGGRPTMRIIAVGGHGGSGPGGCYGLPGSSGNGGLGAQVDATAVRVQSGTFLYVEVGGDGGSGSYDCVTQYGGFGLGGWNGGGNGALPSSRAGSGGGGGATDVRTVSCAQICDQGGGFGTLISLASRIVVAGGGGGGGSGGGAGACGSCRTIGGDGGWGGFPGGTDADGGNGSDATISGTSGITGPGGAGGTGSYGGAGGQADPGCDVDPADPPPCTDGLDGHIAIGGAAGDDPYSYLQPILMGYAGGGGGGGYWGGGGGDGGEISQGDTIGGGGGGGAGSSFGPPGTYYSAGYQQPTVELVSIG